jgi:hypothetical protein
LGGSDATKNLTLADLGEYTCKEEFPTGIDPVPYFSVQGFKTSPEERVTLMWDAPEPSKGKGPPPNFRLLHEYPLPHLKSIIKILTDLGDGNLTNAARAYSPKFINSIDRWTMIYYRIQRENLAKQGVVSFKRGSSVTTSISSEDLSAFTLANIEELSNFAVPDPVAYEDLRLGQTTIQTPGVPLQIQLEAGSVVLVFGILLAVIYFWIFYGEARLSSHFPAQGSLFAAFLRTPASHIIFNLLIAVPGVCSLVLAIWLTLYSFSPYIKLTLIPGILTICFTLAILKSSLPIKTDLIKEVISRVFRRIKLTNSGFQKSENRP